MWQTSSSQLKVCCGLHFSQNYVSFNFTLTSANLYSIAPEMVYHVRILAHYNPRINSNRQDRFFWYGRTHMIRHFKNIPYLCITKFGLWSLFFLCLVFNFQVFTFFHSSARLWIYSTQLECGQNFGVRVTGSTNTGRQKLPWLNFSKYQIAILLV